MVEMVAKIFLLVLCVAFSSAADQVKIGGFRFLAGSKGGTTNSGTIEVQNAETKEWGSICIIGATKGSNFGANEAQIVCANMGFIPFQSSEAATGSSRPRGTAKIMISQLKCDKPDPNERSTWDPNKHCVFKGWESNLGSGCNDHQNDAVVWCAPATAPQPATTIAPDLATLPNVQCDKPSDLIRLNPGPDRGRIEIRKDTSSQWGTICQGIPSAFSLNEARAICKMLCKNSAYAAPVPPSVFGPPTTANNRIALNNLQCPSNANSTNDCTHAGWYLGGSCQPSTMSQGVMCAPEVNTPPPPPAIEVVCDNYRAFVSLPVSVQLTKDLVRLDKPVGAACDFKTAQNTTHVSLDFPIIGCNETQSSNNTHITYTVMLYKDVRPNNANVIVDSPYLIPIQCQLPKVDRVTAKPIGGDLITMPPQTGSMNFDVTLKMYTDRSANGEFVNELANPARVQLGKTIHSVVELHGGGPNVRLVVTSCAASNSRSSGSKSLNMVEKKCGQDYCPTYPPNNPNYCKGALDFQVVANSLSRTRYWFHFPAFKWTVSDTVSQIYITCQVYTCDTNAADPSCSASCNTPLPTSRKRRSISHMNEDSSVRSTGHLEVEGDEGGRWTVELFLKAMGQFAEERGLQIKSCVKNSVSLFVTAFAVFIARLMLQN